jgi:hypothetical protein
MTRKVILISGLRAVERWKADSRLATSSRGSRWGSASRYVCHSRYCAPMGATATGQTRPGVAGGQGHRAQHWHRGSLGFTVDRLLLLRQGDINSWCMLEGHCRRVPRGSQRPLPQPTGGCHCWSFGVISCSLAFEATDVERAQQAPPGWPLLRRWVRARSPASRGGRLP